MGRLAILAGSGALPASIAAADPKALVVGFAGVTTQMPRAPDLIASFERFGALFADLRAASVSDVVFAGGLVRPVLDPARFDATTRRLAPSIMAAMGGGDDGLLRAVITAFEAAGFAVRGAHELLPELTAEPGLLAGPGPEPSDLADTARARAILAALGPLDVGQGVVVAGGQCLGGENAQGTDAMLNFVAATARGGCQRCGVLVKAPKPGQDLRIDMPAVGPATVGAAAKAGLAGIVIEAGHVLLLDRKALVDAAARAGIFVLAQDR